MALTPLLNDVGRKASDFIGKKFDEDDVSCLCQSQILIDSCKFKIGGDA